MFKAYLSEETVKDLHGHILSPNHELPTYNLDKEVLTESDIVNLHKIKDILVYVNSVCNLQCPMCYMQDFKKLPDVDLETFRDIVRKHKRCKISLIGGEPTLHPRVDR